tara:strand:- start:1159 stop:2073 length:915 start_codon:yes stop_codon:yes gene_type:complete
MFKSFKIDKLSIGMRVDRWIRNNIANIPQGLIEKNLRKGNIKLNKKKVKSSQKLKFNDEVKIFKFNYSNIIKQKSQKFNPTKEIVKQNENQLIDDNENFIVINKRSGISVQGGTKSRKNIIDIFSNSKIFDNTKPYSVHRLDKDTSGVLIIAKNRNTAKLLTTLFRLRKMHKKYLAIVNGEIENNHGELKHNLIRFENNKKIIEKAISYYKVLDKNINCSLVELKPITGRKHQLRKQLYELGHPIFGDSKYKLSHSNKSSNKNLMLHAYELKFIINEQKHTYKALLPDHFKKILKIKRLKFLDI